MIVIIDHYSQAPGEKANNRFLTVAEMLVARGFEVEIVTTDFAHIPKKHREIPKEKFDSLPYKYTMLHEPGYEKNISIKRIFSHHMFGKELRKYLKERKDIECVYISVPSLDVGKVAADYCRRNHVPFIVDIQDIWPEAFQMVFHVPVISNAVFYPLRKTADYVYASADDLVAVSQTYLERGKASNKKRIAGHCVYLGTVLEKFDESVERFGDKNAEDNHELRIGYCGTLGSSYDIPCVLDALEKLKNKGINNIRFIVMGDGPKIDEFRRSAEIKELNCLFAGRLQYEEMCGVLSNCDIAVNPIVHGSPGSIINKHGDYAAAGIPVISTQESPEYRKLVDEYQMGINCETGNANDVARAIELLITNVELRKQMGRNARRCAEEKFDRVHSYPEIVNAIVTLVDRRISVNETI